MKKRSTLVRISNRKSNRKSYTIMIEFDNAYDFVKKVDNEIDRLGYDKNVNVLIVNPDVFTDDELDYLFMQNFEF